VTASRTYVLDANVFIEAARHYYAFDIVPSFWQMLIDHANNSLVLSIDRVKFELERGKDELEKWAKNDFRECFVSTEDDEVIAAYRKIMVWSQGQAQFTPGAKAEFARVADGWLVAYALAKVCIVVTREQFNSEAKARIKIPNVCRAFGVQYVDTFEMMRELGVRLG
jgi:predicted nucleic acid-binding protein